MAMPALFDLLENETEPLVRARPGHWLFGSIHPCPDGNGRLARFLMITMLTPGGYPWSGTCVENRSPCLAALERGSVHQDIGPFARWSPNRCCGQRSMPTERAPPGAPGVVLVKGANSTEMG